MDRDRSVVAFGVFAVLVGVGSSYFMVTQPEGLNPECPLGMALLAPAAFTLGGLHMIGAGLGQPRLASAMILATIFCLLAVVDAFVVFLIGGTVWHKYRAPRKEPGR